MERQTQRSKQQELRIQLARERNNGKERTSY